jgi:glyoxylase-like metal-dependent hydrolase (beta-lactamase superfamily II)
MKTWQTEKGQKIFQLISFRSHVFLLTCGGKNILIDTGVKMMRYLLKKRLDKFGVHHIDYLILTHSHFDHAGNAAWIQSTFGARVIIHKEEAASLVSGEIILPQGTVWFTRLPVKLLGKRITPLLRCEPCVPDILVEDMFELKDAGCNAMITHTPGHTPGSVCVIVNDELALVGDTLFGIYSGTVYPVFAVNARQMVQSWSKLLETGCQVFLPSHGRAVHRSLVLSDFERRISQNS